jgi:hypothetical protein
MRVHEMVPDSEEEEQRDRVQHQEREALYLGTKLAQGPGDGTTSEDEDSDSPILAPYVQADRPHKHNPPVTEAAAMATTMGQESAYTSALKRPRNNNTSKSGVSTRCHESGKLAQERTGALRDESARDGTRLRGGGAEGPSSTPGAGSSLSGNEACSRSGGRNHERGRGQRQSGTGALCSGRPTALICCRRGRRPAMRV